MASALSLDFNHKHTAEKLERDKYSRDIVARIDAVAPLALRAQAIADIVADIAANPPQIDERPGRSVSASAIGDECMRRVQLGIWATFHPDKPAPVQQPIDAALAAIFERGHRTETLMAEWLGDAGFPLSTHMAQTPEEIAAGDELKQYGFRAASGHIKGYADGVLFNDGPLLTLWENKTINQRSWSGFVRHGVAKQSPKYDAQAQLLMGYMHAEATMFTFLNAATGDIYAELLQFNLQRAQATSDRAVMILQATRAGDLLPRCASGPDVYPCKQCKRFRDECWGA